MKSPKHRDGTDLWRGLPVSLAFNSVNYRPSSPRWNQIAAGIIQFSYPGPCFLHLVGGFSESVDLVCCHQGSGHWDVSAHASCGLPPTCNVTLITGPRLLL